MGIGSFFGSGGTESEPAYPKILKPMIKPMVRWLRPQIGQWMSPYPGSLYGEGERASLDWLRQYMAGMGQYMPQRQAAYAKMLGGEALAPIDMSASRQWFEQNVMPQYQGRFQEMAAPATEQARAMMGGKSSSAMNRALSETAGGMSRYLGDIGYDFMLREQQAKREREQMNLALQGQAMGMTEPQRAEQLQAIHAGQQYGALEFNREFGEWMRRNPAYNAIFQAIIGLMGSTVGTSTSSRGPGLGYALTTGVASNFMGGLGQGLGTAWGSQD